MWNYIGTRPLAYTSGCSAPNLPVIDSHFTRWCVYYPIILSIIYILVLSTGTSLYSAICNGQNVWVSWCQNSYCSSSEWLEKASWTSSHLFAGFQNLDVHCTVVSSYACKSVTFVKNWIRNCGLTVWIETTVICTAHWVSGQLLMTDLLCDIQGVSWPGVGELNPLKNF